MAILLYHGWIMRALRRDLMPQAIVIPEPGDDAPAAPAPASQMPLMALPEGVARPVKTRGHAMPPGSGPVGETCGTCLHYAVRRSSHRKCGLIRAKWTAGPGTDIRKKDPACVKWSDRKGVVE
ncbi:MAG TPA: hypothetical protein PLO69_11215 [Gammaproteobacteria bacterium]|nr:hypothetical protein [Gammaproteobacteria bacterium]